MNFFKKINNSFYNNAHLLLILTTLGWATNIISAKLAIEEVSPIMLIFLRWGIVSILLFTLKYNEIVTSFSKIKGRIIWILLMGGVGICSFNALFYIAAKYTTGINLGIIQSCLPALVILSAYIFFNSKINIYQFLGLILTFCGVIFIVSQGSLNTIFQLSFYTGDIIMILDVICYSGYTLGLQKRPKINSLTLFSYISFAAWITTVPLLSIELYFNQSFLPTQFGWFLIIYIAIVPSLICQIYYIRGVDLIGPGQAGLYTNLVPVFAAILAILILSEKIYFYHLFALVLVFSGIYLFEKTKAKPSLKKN